MKIFLLLLIIPNTSAELTAVCIIHRHGERTPIGTYPTDPFKGTWPEGFGALTKEGYEKMFHHGQRMKLRYSKRVKSDWYTESNINIQSSIIERCPKSAQGLMSGFLSPPETRIPVPWWKPVHINALPPAEDNMIASTAPCSLYNKSLNSYLTKPPGDIAKFLKKNPEYMKDLETNSGSPIINIYSAFMLLNILLVERENGVELREWGTKALKDGWSFYENCFELLTYTDFMKKAQYGGLITDILNKFKGVINGTDTHTIFQYSGHDSTILGLARLLGIQKQIPIVQGYGATINFELEQTKGAYIISAFYWESADTLLPKKLAFPECCHPCSLNDFYNAYRYFIIEPPATYASICS